jgi:ribosomal protein S18 acetylase RimI-like enzyme
MGVTIEKMTLRHYEAAVKLWKQCEGVHLGKADEREAIARYLRRNAGMSLVAMDNVRLVGTVLCGHDGRRGILHHLAVAKDCRGTGVGKTLVTQAQEKLKAAGLDRCWILILADNGAARQFWKALGWQESLQVVYAGKDL